GPTNTVRICVCPPTAKSALPAVTGAKPKTGRLPIVDANAPRSPPTITEAQSTDGVGTIPSLPPPTYTSDVPTGTTGSTSIVPVHAPACVRGAVSWLIPAIHTL